jgi:ATP-binding cassette subfamily B (MDR/TAP) protein 1
MFAISVELGFKIDNLDVVTTFQNGELQEVVYVQQHEGFVVKGKKEKVCLLQKGLYGLKQSSRAGNDKIILY